ncbi:serine/threonine-protein phosphatase, partial [Candidatus Microgenomates bacterium]
MSDQSFQEFARPPETSQRLSATLAVENRAEKGEDSFWTEGSNFAVFDGMGGMSGGKEAASRANLVFSRKLKGFSSNSNEFEARRTLEEAFIEAGRGVRNGVPESGTTAVAALFVEGGKKVVIGNIGDSRVYLYRDGRLEQITKDHNPLNEMVDAGKITPSEAKAVDQAKNESELKNLRPEVGLFYKHRNKLVRYLGSDEEELPDIFVLALKPGDRIIGVTDGVSDNLTDEEIKEALFGNSKQVAKRLVEKALERAQSRHFRAKKDDITVVATEVTGYRAEPALKPEEKSREKPSIASSQLFSELLEALKGRTIMGSHNFTYKTEDLVNRIKGYLSGELDKNYITNGERLRDKVVELRARAVKRGGNPT